MAQNNSNNVYLKIDAVAVTAYFVDVELSPSMESVDVTAGGASTHRERNEGLADNSISITLSYDAADVQTYIQQLKPGTHTIEFGPEGNATGKPKHVQSFIITEAPFSVTVEKEHVTFSISGEGAAAPTSDMFSGAVY